jgi:3-hydroxy-9,10-secoandrosta-1,3,5(10)-triene-9,17-dione monooxygenase reductase component
MASAIDQAVFRQVLGHFPTGVVIVAAPGPVGTAIGSFFSVSLDPALVGFCIGRSSSTWPKIREAGVFCVSILGEDQEAVCRTFATSGVDKFEGLGWSAASSGSPRVHDAVAWIDCDIEMVHDGGDHDICVGRVREMEVEREVGPLLFFRGGYGRFAV